MKYEWSMNEVWFSNEGHGPICAKILCISEGIAYMVRWSSKSKAKSPRLVKFGQKADNLFGHRTGWRRK